MRIILINSGLWIYFISNEVVHVQNSVLINVPLMQQLWTVLKNLVITHLRFIIWVKMFSFADSVTEVELNWAQVDILVTEPKPMLDINRAAITPLAKNILANIPEVERSQTSQRNVELADTVSLYRNSAQAIKKDAFSPRQTESLWNLVWAAQFHYSDLNPGRPRAKHITLRFSTITAEHVLAFTAQVMSLKLVLPLRTHGHSSIT